MGAESKLAALRAAVEDAYRTFETARPEKWSGDDLDLGREYWARLETVPLRELNRSDTDHFLSETGRFLRHEIRYILPRVIELLAEGESPHAAGMECSLNCLAQSGYPQDWTDGEVAAVEAFFAQLLDATIAGVLESDGIGTLFCMVANAHGDLPALLDRGDRADPKTLARAIASDLDIIGGLDADGGLINAFWETAPGEHKVSMVDWYRRPKLVSVMEQAFFSETDPRWQQKISDALETMRRWPPRDTPSA
ncbi:MAG: hypothetical protein OEN23_10385 [Paracoccaceae bacterium]|nr:hypothetical protein [Paracoccaceae bacterium]